MWRVAIGTHAGVGKCHTIACLHHWRHLLQIYLVHDAIVGRNDVDVLKGRLGPLDEVETVFITPILDSAVLLKSVRFETGMLYGQRMVDDQLSRYHRIDLGGITTLLGNGVT